ncbi:MAG: hypothetical protein Q4E33_05310 [Erysipelotrichaceae bacterium]|nr:hypothetical protein [Erysipelotrichaceae bacterium]
MTEKNYLTDEDILRVSGGTAEYYYSKGQWLCSLHQLTNLYYQIEELIEENGAACYKCQSYFYMVKAKQLTSNGEVTISQSEIGTNYNTCGDPRNYDIPTN